ncbi:coiled-coil domain-containing protein 97 [Brachionichthys hirsutus]|uniref:coiled-coil domain-containing protein 97 n=1 Tax=Brachionichthys hirsutus TaxID=412623 RepID=UPI0036053263
MWGEIEAPVKIQPDLCDIEEKSKLPEEVVTLSPRCYLKSIAYTQQPRRDAPGVSKAESACVNNMVEAIAVSAGPVRSQQIGDPEMTVEERREELLQQYSSRPLVFLERYYAWIKPRDLSAFAHVCSDPRTQHYSNVIQRRAAACTNRIRVRNQRYAALRALQKEGQYFSEEQMRTREPLLYEQYIGQYLTDEEVLERSQEANAAGATDAGTGGLAGLLLNTYQEHLIQNRLQAEQEREEGAQEEDEDEEKDARSVQQQEAAPTAEEKALLREEFISQMHQRFLDGKDTDFNYSDVDENPDYDNLDIVSRDAEEKYFDEDDEEGGNDVEENMTE